MTSPIPESLDALLRREPTAEALTKSGYPIKGKTLATKASRGGGPPYRKFGPWPLYRWGDSLAWARARLSEPRSTTSEAGAPPPSSETENEPARWTERATEVQMGKKRIASRPHRRAG
jgi:hypothetical protein